MKASELRIGNLLQDKVSKTELKVIELTEKDIITYVVDRSMFPLKHGWGLEPIPLTEEWLLKFGFEEDGESFIHGNGWLIVDWPTVHYSIDIWRHNENYPTTSDWSEIPSCIDYVHQLQNLYFALTGEELTIKNE